MHKKSSSLKNFKPAKDRSCRSRTPQPKQLYQSLEALVKYLNTINLSQIRRYGHYEWFMQQYSTIQDMNSKIARLSYGDLRNSCRKKLKEVRDTLQRIRLNYTQSNLDVMDVRYVKSVHQTSCDAWKKHEYSIEKKPREPLVISNEVRTLQKSGDFELQRTKIQLNEMTLKMQQSMTDKDEEVRRYRESSNQIQKHLEDSIRQNECLRETISRLYSYNINKSNEIKKLKTYIFELNKIINKLREDTEEEPADTTLLRKLYEKNTIIQELIYEKYNYSDGYTHLRHEKAYLIENIEKMEQEKYEKMREIQKLNSKIQEIYGQADDYKEYIEYLLYKINKIEMYNKELINTVRDLRLELKETKVELRTIEQKSEMYQYRYFKMRQNSCYSEYMTRTHKTKFYKISTDRTEAIHIHYKSTERNMERTYTGRKMKVMADLKALVTSHRLNICSSLR